MKLYEITDQWKCLKEASEAGFYETDEELEMLKDSLDGIRASLIEKLDAIQGFRANLEAEASAIKAEEQRLADRRKALEKKSASMKEYMEQQLISAGIDAVRSAIWSYRIQNNPPRVSIIDESKVPEDYLVPQPAKIDKNKIAQHLKEGKDLGWVSLEQTNGIRIR